MNENEIVDEIRVLFNQSKVNQCLKQVDEFKNQNQQLDFTIYQTIELYKCLSYFRQGYTKQGNACIQQLIKLSKEKKGDKIDEIDLIIQAEYQIQNVDADQASAIQLNQNLLDYTLKYQEQHQRETNYNEGIYLYGFGIFNFVEQLDQKVQNTECINQLFRSYNTVVSFKQEIGFNIGGVLFFLEKKDQLLTFCKAFYEINPKYPGIAGVLALAYSKQQKFEEAEKYFKLAQQLCPESIIELINASQLYNQYQQKEKELECLELAYNLNSESVLTCLHYGIFLNENDQKEKGLKITNDALLKNPSSHELIIHSANTYFENQNFQFGIQILEEFITKNPTNLSMIYFFIQLLFDLAEYRKIQVYIQKYQSLNKRDSQDSQQVKIYKSISLYKCQSEKDSLLEFLGLLNSSKIQIDEQVVIKYILKIFNKTKILSHLFQIIFDIYGPMQMRLNLLIEEKGLEKNPIVLILKLKQDIFREIHLILAYKKQIQEYLSYQNNMSHWDLFMY